MLYIISIIILFTLILIVPKSKEKLNIIKTITITLIALFAYNTFICYILNFINIPITLISLSIVNFIISVLLICKIIKNKEIQKYEIIKRDIISTIVILSIIIITISINFSGISRIRYISMDCTNHYKAAREFSENTKLFNKETENSTTSKCFMPMGYVNVGILFKIFRQYIGTINLYKVYILFESTIYFLVGMMFYFCLQNKIKTKNQILVGIVLSIFYVIGYPFNALICGFHYLLLGILYFITIFDVIVNVIQTKKIEFKFIVTLLTLLNIGLIFSYALFCPFVYLAEFVYFIIKYKKDKNKKEIFLITIFSLILTGLMGCDIVLFQRINELGETGINIDGWIYKNTFSNIILFLPFVIYYIVKLIKEKGKIFEKSLIIFFVVFLSLLAIGTKLKLCSSYYFYKNYYILWFLIFYMASNVIIQFIEQGETKKYIANGFIAFYTFLFFIFILFIDTPIQTEETEENTRNLMEIYTFNKTNINIDIPYVYKEELELFEKLDNILEIDWKDSPSVLMIGEPPQQRWLQSLTGYYHSIYPDAITDIKKWNNGEYEYLIILEKREPYDILKKAIKIEDAELVYQNDVGKLYIKKRRVK